MNPHTGLVHVRYWPAPAIWAGDVIEECRHAGRRSLAAIADAHPAATWAELWWIGICQITDAAALLTKHGFAL